MSLLPQGKPPDAVEDDLARRPEPAWIIDPARARVIAASPAARVLWNGALREGVSLDRAMPAVSDLSRLTPATLRTAGAREAGADQLRNLLIWTAQGAVNLQCLCRPLAGEERRVLVRVVEAPVAGKRLSAAVPHGELGVLAHELRTPLSAIAALAEVMEEERLGAMGNSRYLGYASDIRESAHHALSVLRVMLEDQRDDGAPVESAAASVDVAVARCISILRELACRASVRLVTDLVQGQPRLAVEERSLIQMLLNLLSNALKFSPPDGEIRIATRLEPDGGLVLSVADRGPGMARDVLQRLETQATPSEEPPDGSGYGLPIVMALAQASGARVTVESERGKGTKISIAFPRERVLSPVRTTV